MWVDRVGVEMLQVGMGVMSGLVGVPWFQKKNSIPLSDGFSFASVHLDVGKGSGVKIWLVGMDVMSGLGAVSQIEYIIAFRSASSLLLPTFGRPRPPPASPLLALPSFAPMSMAASTADRQLVALCPVARRF